MHPHFLRIGPIQIYWYGVFMAFAAMAGLLNWTLLGRKTKRDFNFCSDMLFWIMLSGIIGARIAYILANLHYFIANPAEIIRIDRGGIIFFGGLIGAGIALYLFAIYKKEKYMDLLDFVITSIPLGHAIGRIGCFMNGCCYGSAHNGWLAVSFPKHSLAWDHQIETGLLSPLAARSLTIYPVQLFESVLCLLIFIFLHFVYKKHKKNGTVLGAYLVTYPVVRFFLEFIRGDPRVKYGTPLSIAQYISIILFIMGCTILLSVYHNNKKMKPENQTPENMILK